MAYQFNVFTGTLDIVPPNGFADNVFSIYDDADPTKILKFDLSDLASPRTVTVRIPEMDTAGGEPSVLVLAQESFGGGSYRVGADWEFADINIGTPSVGFLTILPTHSTPGTQTNLYNTQTADRLQYLANATSATYLPWNSGATDGHLPLAGSLVYGGGANTALAELAIGAANAVLHVNSGATAPEWSTLTYVQSTGRLGVGVAAPTYAISISGEAAQTIAMERELTANNAGRNLTVQAGGAVSGGSNRAGGKAILSGGISTGTQGSTAEIWTAAGGSSGTTDRTPSVKLAIAATGAAAFTQNAVAGNGITGTTFSTTAPSVGANGFIGQSWNFNSLLLADGSAFGLQMQLASSVSTADTGSSGVSGFAFELYCSTEDDTVNHPGATAVGGFIQATGPGRTGPMIGAQYQTNVSADADAFCGVSVAPNFINTGVTLDVYTGLRILNFATFSGTITTTYGIYMEDLSAQNANAYSIYSLGGLGVHVGNFMFGSTSAPTEQIELADAKNIKFQTTTGTKIGTATGQKLAFHNSTPVIQRAGAAQAAVATTASTNIAPYGYTTSAQADAIVTLVNEIRATLVEKGLMKGSA